MSRTIMLIPVGTAIDLSKAANNVEAAVVAAGKTATLFTPIASEEAAGTIASCQAAQMIANKQHDLLMENIVAQFEEIRQDNNVILVEGIRQDSGFPFAAQLNADIAQTLGAEIIFVIAGQNATCVERLAGVATAMYKGTHVGAIVADASVTSVAALPFIGSIDAIDAAAIKTIVMAPEGERRLSPPAFRHELSELARKAAKRIVLPEGDEPRTVKAAAICAERKIATCVLLGNPADIQRVAKEQGVTLGEGIEIIDPEAEREKYVPRFVELRASKGLTAEQAREQLQDNVVLGTLMLEQDDVDGLVSGAVHTTANTIRPPLQLIKTAPGSSLVSSVFFMLMPDQVYLYGDCAINPEPNAEQLSEIAIQSAETAIAFGIEPRVAMLSYSTGTSGKGAAVEKVIEATRIAKEKRPDLMIDGPLQYDASVMADVAASKAPNSPVAGKANVFIFPDLNAGNIGYKAVQRSADLVSVGPMLQGMRKPVNDLSRGALVDDIVYTVALTAIQAAQAAAK